MLGQVNSKVFSQPDQLLLANLQKGAKCFEGLQFIYLQQEM
jgi:hypothetical protein